MRSGALFRRLGRALFILYCIEVGVFLTLAPWRVGWSTLLIQFPFERMRELLFTQWGRGAVSGFGLVHLVWGLHDLRELVRRRGGRRPQTDERAP